VSERRRDPDLAALVEKIAREHRFGFDAYKESCLRRRVAVRMRVRGTATYEEYAELLDRDTNEYESLLDTLTINVTKFYRNRETWEALARYPLRDLLRSRGGQVCCWSAGCASGEEPFTLAILLFETAAHERLTATAFQIDATDFDSDSLDRARRGEYGKAAFDEMPADLARRYFSDGNVRVVDQRISGTVRFRRHDITREPPPEPPYDLIMCRNVLIYFDRATQDRLVSQFVEALRPGGYLVLGRAETILGDLRERVKLEDPRERIYRRP